MRSTLLLLMLFCSVLFAENVPARTTSQAAAGADAPMQAAIGPNAKVPKDSLFRRFVGTWDVTYEIYDKTGNLRRYHGQVVYRWILDGEALQEVWTSDAHNKVAQPYSTTISFHDDKRERWSVIWIYPAQGVTTIVRGNEANGRIVLTGADEAGPMQRWTIGEFQTGSFVSRFEKSEDDGKTWQLVGVNYVQRHSG